MKRFFTVLALSAIIALPVSAQDRPSDEIAFSYGVVTPIQMGMVLTSAMFEAFSVGGWTLENVSMTGSISAEYIHNFNDHIGIGLIGSFESFMADAFIDSDPCGTFGERAISVLPAVKFNWIDREHFSMYSKAAAGLTLIIAPEDDLSEAVTSPSFGFQASVLGFEFGSRTFMGFIEGGMGMQGMALAGLRFAL